MNEAIKKALEVLRNGGVILYPTDTVWGIGCDATNDEAVNRIYEIKKRNDQKSMLILLDNMAKLDRYVSDVPDLAYDLIEISDKPLTIIYEKSKGLSENISKKDKSIGVRITDEAFSKRLVEQFKRPIISTSANISGELSPTCFSEISEEIKSAVDYVVEFRQEDEKAVPSSIIMLGNNSSIKVIRE
ncbi:MAG: L-threonylcarbamoyladenylate synthase [Bacteroidales bacterium]|jgi:L-threonylcarbamoyladenylate synthase|nr:L-threonylcarbamoyladenylate synthase [Bacteroidales bacterium]